MLENAADTAWFEALAVERAHERVSEANGEIEVDVTAMAVVFNLVRVANQFTYDLEVNVHRPAGWTWAGFRILFTVWIVGPIEPRVLAKLAGVTRASVSSALNTLERDGFLVRSRRSADRRVVTVMLTDEGRERIAETFKDHNVRESELLAPLSFDEQRQLADLLRRLLVESSPE